MESAPLHRRVAVVGAAASVLAAALAGLRAHTFLPSFLFVLALCLAAVGVGLWTLRSIAARSAADRQPEPTDGDDTLADLTIEDRGAIVTHLRSAGCVFAEDEATILTSAAIDDADLRSMLELRVSGYPLEQIVGWTDFCGWRLAVTPGVFVPRRSTQLLVQEATAITSPHAVVVDLCCGTGAIGLALLSAVGDVQLHAADIDPAAVACARGNIGVSGTVYEGDLYSALPHELRGTVDTITANVPYVPSDAIDLMPREARDFEPRVALDGGADGLDVVRRVAGEASKWLRPGGNLLVETAPDQAPTARTIFTAAGLTARTVADESSTAVVVIGTRPE
ncbi:putative protein N(5)-glutamine methyltransferase [Millisia brevis]|uniref:putative protein N(5)-glutamine methyltransferase n=1 Tax=Millisia brevis TaxID=264148 RepID=UPI000B30EB85|nr:putative protein N(5)-glutamine methyltransferase [Millisia brevis]